MSLKAEKFDMQFALVATGLALEMHSLQAVCKWQEITSVGATSNTWEMSYRYYLIRIEITSISTAADFKVEKDMTLDMGTQKGLEIRCITFSVKWSKFPCCLRHNEGHLKWVKWSRVSCWRRWLSPPPMAQLNLRLFNFLPFSDSRLNYIRVRWRSVKDCKCL